MLVQGLECPLTTLVLALCTAPAPTSPRRAYPFYSVFRSSCIVSCGSEVVGAFGGREDVDEAADGGPKALDGAFGGLAQECFQFGEGVLDGVEIGRVRREGEQACTRRLDQGSHAGPPVAPQGVPGHHAAPAPGRGEGPPQTKPA